MTIGVSVVSGAVKVAQLWLSKEVEVARIAHEALTERVRCAAPWTSMQESTDRHHVWVAQPTHRNGGEGRNGGGDEH
jgi:hypothetical protein